MQYAALLHPTGTVIALNEAERAARAKADTAQAVRFMAIKAAIFILIPLIVSAVMVWWKFG